MTMFTLSAKLFSAFIFFALHSFLKRLQECISICVWSRLSTFGWREKKRHDCLFSVVEIFHRSLLRFRMRAQNCNKLTMSAWCIYALIIKTIPYNLFTFVELCFLSMLCVWFLNSFIALSFQLESSSSQSSVDWAKSRWKMWMKHEKISTLLLFNRHSTFLFTLIHLVCLNGVKWWYYIVLWIKYIIICLHLMIEKKKESVVRLRVVKRDERSALLIKKWFFFTHNIFRLAYARLPWCFSDWLYEKVFCMCLLHSISLKLLIYLIKWSERCPLSVFGMKR